MDRHAIGSTVNLDLTIEASGVGITGQTPLCVVQRLSDGHYHDSTQPTGSQFASAFFENAMVEVDATNLPGLYRFQFNHAEDLTGSDLFFIRLSNAGVNGLIDDYTIVFGRFVSATAPELCSLFGTVLDINGNPDTSKPVRLSIIPNTILPVGDKPGMSVDRVDTFTDINGQFSVDVVRNLTVRLQIPSIGYDRKIIIPDAPSANFADL